MCLVGPCFCVCVCVCLNVQDDVCLLEFLSVCVMNGPFSSVYVFTCGSFVVDSNPEQCKLKRFIMFSKRTVLKKAVEQRASLLLLPPSDPYLQPCKVKSYSNQNPLSVWPTFNIIRKLRGVEKGSAVISLWLQLDSSGQHVKGRKTEDWRNCSRCIYSGIWFPDPSLAASRRKPKHTRRERSCSCFWLVDISSAWGKVERALAPMRLAKKANLANRCLSTA